MMFKQSSDAHNQHNMRNTLPTDFVLFWTSIEYLWAPESILRTSENIYKSENTLRTTENIWEPIIVSLVQFEKDFNTLTKMSADIVFVWYLWSSGRLWKWRQSICNRVCIYANCYWWNRRGICLVNSAPRISKRE